MKRRQITQHRITWLVLPLVMAGIIALSLAVKPGEGLQPQPLPALLTDENR